MPKKHYLSLSQGREYPYTIVRSSRAKYIRLKLSNTGLLSLVIPNGATLKNGLTFIQSKKVWIEKQLENIDIQSDDLPSLLDLKLLKEQWRIVYQKEDLSRIYLQEDENNLLVIKGDIAQKSLVKKLINKWCQYKAKALFNEMLSGIALEYGFNYRKLSIRSQKTRWGSCSQDKNINLNSKLLFFKEEIVRHVMIHELCHTVEMNHSKQFWMLVKSCDPDYLSNREKVKLLGKKIVW